VSPVKYKLGSYIPEDAILHSHRSENLKSYILYNFIPVLANGRKHGNKRIKNYSVCSELCRLCRVTAVITFTIFSASFHGAVFVKEHVINVYL
jgi:hypothetical protein